MPSRIGTRYSLNQSQRTLRGMEAAAEPKYTEKECESISASPDFAQTYVFIQTFGRLLKLPFVTLTDLEQFFIEGK